MSLEENLIKRSSQTDKNISLQKELEQAHEIIRNYEAIIADLRLKNSTHLKHFTHELSNPLQILSMTIEMLQDRPSADISGALERMKRSADNMAAIIISMRKLRAATTQSSVNADIKVI